MLSYRSLGRVASVLTFVAACAFTSLAPGQAASLPPMPSVWLADLTWLELRTAMEAGVDTVLIPLGGIEARGSHLVLGANNRVLTTVTAEAAGKDGMALIAPVIPFAPEINEDSLGILRWPGTLHISPDSIGSVVAEVATSLKVHGIHHIILVTNQAAAATALRDTAQALNKGWAVEGVVVGLADLSDDEAFQQALLKQFKLSPEQNGDHGGLIETAEMLACCSDGVRQSTLPRTPAAVETSGASGRPDLATAEIGRASLAHKVRVIQDSITEVRTVAAEIKADLARMDAEDAKKAAEEKKAAPAPDAPAAETTPAAGGSQ